MTDPTATDPALTPPPTDSAAFTETTRQPDAEWRVRAVQRRLARAVLPPLPEEALGAVRLLPHQRRAAARLHRIIGTHGGALLADAVGLGKTYTALAVAQRYTRVAVLAPAGLIAMWQAALLRTGQRHIAVHSLHRASHHPPPAFADANTAANATTNATTNASANAVVSGRALVIIDEAHALRHRTTKRYHHVSRAVVGCDVLLLSATPLHNSPHDLHTLFALFLGASAGARRRPQASALVVRREHVAPSTASASLARPPRVRIHRPRAIPQDRQTLEHLLAVPDPLAARDGAVAGALIRLGLLRAWCSSDSALTHALNRRLQRGAALREALAAGRHPSARELQSWVLGDDLASDMQLGFADLLVSPSAAVADPSLTLRVTLDRHCDALRTLRDHHVATSRADAVRAAYLRRVCERHRGTPVVAFSQHARTVQALFRALGDIAGVGMLTSRRARIASGPVTRPELLGYFAPSAQGRPPPPAVLAVRLLLTTDLIAEGVNLQDAGVVVHLDLPWTHALYLQRTGRVARLGSPHAVVHAYRLSPPAAARRALRLEARIGRKAMLAARLVGGTVPRSSTPTRARVVSDVDRCTQWMDRLEHWAWSAEPPDMEPGSVERPATARTAIIPARGPWCGAIVLVHTADGAQLLAVVCRHAHVWISHRPDALLAVSDGRCPSRCVQATARRAPATLGSRGRTALQRTVVRAVRRWMIHRHLRHSAGLSEQQWLPDATETVHTGPGVPWRPSPAQRRARRWVEQRVASWTAVERERHRATLAAACRCIVAARGAGVEASLYAWTRVTETSVDAALAAWQRFPLLVRALAATPGSAHAASDQSAFVPLAPMPPVRDATAPTRGATGRIEAWLLVC